MSLKPIVWFQFLTVKSCYANVSACTFIWGNVEQCWFFCLITHSLHLWFENSVTIAPCVLIEFLLPLPGNHMCTSERQSNTTAIYTHWVRWKVLGLSLRPRSPKRMGKKTDKAGKRPVHFYILGCLGCFPMAGTQTCTQTHNGAYSCVCVWASACAVYSRNSRHTRCY